MTEHDERYPQQIVNFNAWFSKRMGEIKTAQSPEDLEHVLHRIREYADAKWCFAWRVSDAESLANSTRKARGWKAQTFTDRMTGDAA